MVKGRCQMYAVDIDLPLITPPPPQSRPHQGKHKRRITPQDDDFLFSQDARRLRQEDDIDAIPIKRNKIRLLNVFLGLLSTTSCPLLYPPLPLSPTNSHTHLTLVAMRTQDRPMHLWMHLRTTTVYESLFPRNALGRPSVAFPRLYARTSFPPQLSKLYKGRGKWEDEGIKRNIC